MLNKRTADFVEMVWSAVATCGKNAPKIADRILKKAFPRTVEEAAYEGADKMLRKGVIAEIKRIIRNEIPTDEQRDFSDIEPNFTPIVRRLKSNAYYVEGLQEYCSIPELIENRVLLDDARKHLRKKGEECLADAAVLDELYEAVGGDDE